MMKRQIDYRLLATLALGSAIAIGLAFLVHAVQMRRHAHTLMAQAQQAESEGRLDQAMRAWQRYLVFAPQDNAARARCGELMEQLAVSDHERWRALDVYEQVVYREPSRQDIRRRLARLALRLGWTSEAHAHLQILLRDQPGQGDLECLIGQCQEEAGDYPLAAASYQNAILSNPEQVEAYVRLAHLFTSRLDQPEHAKRVLDELVRNNSHSAEAYLARAVYRNRHGALVEARRDVEQARALAPEDTRVLLLSAELARRLGALDEARNYLHIGRQRQPRNLALHLALATLEWQYGDKREAIACLRQGLKALPDQPDLLLLLAESLLDLGDEREAEPIIQRLSRGGLPPGMAHYLSGRLQFQRRQWTRAQRTLEEVTQLPEVAPTLASRAYVFLALCQEKRGERERQLASLRKAVSCDPSSARARLALAEALHQRGRSDEAVEQGRELVQLPQAPDESWILLGRLLLERNRSLPPRKRRWSEVEQVVERARLLPALEVPLALLRADVLLEQEKTGEARDLLQKTASLHPEQSILWTALADLAARQGEPAQSLTILENAFRQARNPSELYKAEITLIVQTRPPGTHHKLRDIEKGLDRLPKEEQRNLLVKLATAYFRLGDFAEGRRLDERLCERLPDSVPALVPLLDLALEGGDQTLLTRLIEDLRRLEGEDGIWWRYAEAARLLLRSNQAQARDQAQMLIADLARRRPDWTRIILLQAHLHELDGELEQAANAYRRAYQSGECQPGLAERLVRLFVEQGRLDDADPVIRTAQQRGQLSPELARMGAEIALRQRSNERAQELAHRAVAKEKADYAQLIWLGQVLSQAGQLNQCEEVLRQAIHLREDLAETWLALIAHLAKVEQLQAAEEVCAAMRRCLPAEQVPLALAVAAEAMARWDQASAYYRQALDRTPQDGIVLQRAAHFYVRLLRADDAKPLLRRMLDPRIDLPDVNRSWARRQLALLLAFADLSAPLPSSAEALTLLQANPKTLLDERARLLVRATNAKERPSMLPLLEQKGKVQRFTAEELYCLVMLHEVDEEENAAQERMLDLLALDRNNPEYLAHHIDLLLRRGRGNEARSWIARLRKIEPDSARVQTFTTRARQATAKP